MAISRRLAAGGAVTLVLGVLVSLVGFTAHASTTTDPNACPAPKVPVTSTVNCPTETPSTAPSGSPTPMASSAPATETPQTGAQKSFSGEGVEFGQDEEPTGWAGPIAKDLGQGVQGLSEDLAEKLKKDGLLPKFEFSQAYLSLYALMFGLGVIIALLATMLASVKVAAAKGVDSRIMAQQALIRVLAFSAVGGLAPLLLAVVGDITHTLAGGFFDLAADQMVSSLTWLAGALAVGTLASIVVPGGSAVMVGLFLFLLASLAGIFLELMISHFLIFLLGLLVPILFAASINPDWRGGVKKVSGALLGAFLAPAALFLVWVVTFAAVAPWGSDNSFFTRVGVLLVGLLLSLAAPIAIGMLLSYVVPVFANGHGYDTNAFKAAGERVSRRTGRQQPSGPRGSRSKRASSATDDGASPAAESPTAARGGGAAAPGASSGGAASGSAAGAAALGPVAAAVGIWTKLAGKARRTAETVRDTVAGNAGRGDAVDQPDADPTARQPGGQQPQPGSSLQGGRGQGPTDQRPAPDRPVEAGARDAQPAGSRSRGTETQAGATADRQYR